MTPPPVSARIDRRSFVAALAAGLAGLGSTVPAHADAADDARKFMDRVAGELFAAHKIGTVDAFEPAITRNSDIAAIGMYCLGSYARDLPPSHKDDYLRGVGRFIARYFAEQTRTYRIAKWEVLDATAATGSDLYVNTRVTLLTGEGYNVVWQVSPRGKGFKVVDVKVLGFSLTFMQRGLFMSYIQKHDGDLKALLAALERQ